jgi:alpha-beta hydrolase superfamily lysophospholipase
MKLIKIQHIFFTLIVFFTAASRIIMSTPFSFIEIQQLSYNYLKNPSFVTASDSCKLAYYPYIPSKPKAIVLFYCGAGLYGNSIHQWIAKELQEKHEIGTCIVDIRGHGNSEGARGDAPNIQIVWNDISVMIDHIRNQYPNIPLYLAGHSSGAGLLLNYAAWPLHKAVNGLILLAPYLGPMSGALKEHKNPDEQFAKKVRTWVYIVAGISKGLLFSHIPAVYFNYPESVLEDKKILKYYTYTMSCATTPYQTKEIFQSINVPIALFASLHDEQFDAKAIVHYADYLPNNTYRYTEIVDEKHLAILLKTPSLISQVVERFST